MRHMVRCAKELNAHPSFPESFKYVWLEGEMKARLDLLERVPNWGDPVSWPAGRVFGSDGEYRWQAHTVGWPVRAVAILDMDVPLEGFEEPIEVFPSDEDSRADLILWGEWVAPGPDRESNPEGGPRFYAREIPSILDYPLGTEDVSIPGETPRIAIRRYRDDKFGEFIRCAGFRMKSEINPGRSGQGGSE